MVRISQVVVNGGSSVHADRAEKVGEHKFNISTGGSLERDTHFHP